MAHEVARTMASKTKIKNIALTAAVSFVSLLLVRCGPLTPSIAKSMQAPIPIPTPDPQTTQQAISIQSQTEGPVVVVSAKEKSEHENHGNNVVRLAVGENDIEFGDFIDSGEFEIDSIKGKTLKKIVIEVSKGGLSLAKEKQPEVLVSKAEASRLHVIFDVDSAILKEVRALILIFE